MVVVADGFHGLLIQKISYKNMEQGLISLTIALVLRLTSKARSFLGNMNELDELNESGATWIKEFAP